MKKSLLFILLSLLVLIPKFAFAHDVVADLENMNPASASYLYFTIGFKHILPYGLDHIMFILSLVLLSPNLKQLFFQSAAFTAGHCITLALAMLNIVKISSSIVEPLIAATIIYIALENIFSRKLNPSRIILIFAFGLLHGMGFASALSDIGVAKDSFVLTLFMFNFGIEFGQICIIIASYTLLTQIQKRNNIPWRKLAIPVSVIIVAVGSFWLIERIV